MLASRVVADSSPGCSFDHIQQNLSKPEWGMTHFWSPQWTSVELQPSQVAGRFPASGSFFSRCNLQLKGSHCVRIMRNISRKLDPSITLCSSCFGTTSIWFGLNWVEWMSIQHLSSWKYGPMNAQGICRKWAPPTFMTLESCHVYILSVKITRGFLYCTALCVGNEQLVSQAHKQQRFSRRPVVD